MFQRDGTEAAEQPNLFEQNILDRFFVDPDDKWKNKRKTEIYGEKASQLFFQAAQQGDAHAQVNLGQNFKIGRNGMPQDNTEAYYW